jgi:hypothetical protein
LNLDQLFKLLDRARNLSRLRDFVIIGSNTSLALAERTEIPAAMVMSMDLDCYTKDDPERVFELVPALGENSPFHHAEGFFLDAVSPDLPTLPEGWQDRLLKLERGGCRAWFLDPNDAAISKYARGEPRDRSWIRAGLDAGIVSMPRIKYLVGRTFFLNDAEQEAALAGIEEDERRARSS